MRVSRGVPGRRGLAVAAVGAVALALPAGAAAETGRHHGHEPSPFLERDARVLHTLRGETGSYFGWALSELGDRDHAGGADLVIGERWGDGGQAVAGGAVDVVDGRTARQRWRVTGQPGDQLGYAIADAGDVNGDGWSDVIAGAPGNGAGHADLLSGRTGRLLHRFEGEVAGDFFGSAVSGVGDVDRDGRPDLLVSAARHDAGTGRAYLLSGRTHRTLLTLDGEGAGDAFGTAVDGIGDVDGDRRPDLLVGARNAGDPTAFDPAGAGRVYVFSGRTGAVRATVEATADGGDLGWFFVGGIGDVDGDRVPDVYAADFDDITGGLDEAGNPAGRAGVYSGRDGHQIHAWVGDPGDGAGPGREAGDVDRDGVDDLAVGKWTSSAAAENAGEVTVYSGRTGGRLVQLTGTQAATYVGFDVIGLGDLTFDRVPDLAVSAAGGDVVYLVAMPRR